MKKLLLPFLLFSIPVFAQNLITNPGFEEYSGTNSYSGDDDFKASGVTGWFNPSHSTPDFEDGGSYAHSGNNSGGGFMIDLDYYQGAEYREYVAGTLTQALVAGETYRFSIAATSNGFDNATVSELGVYFTSNEYHGNTQFEINAQPQIVLDSADDQSISGGWVILHGSFTATGGEKYFVVGNFRDNAHSVVKGSGATDAVVYYFDDLCLKGIDEPVTSDENYNEASYSHTSANAYSSNNNYYSNANANNNSHNNDQYHNSQVTNYSNDYSGTKVYDHYGDSITEKSDFHYEGGAMNIRIPVISDEVIDMDVNDDAPNIGYDQVYTANNYADSLSTYSASSSQTDSVYVEVGVDLISNNIYFDADEYVLLSDSYVTLDKIVQGLKDKPWVNVEVHGWTENMKKGRYSRRLSRHRAEAVANYLLDNGIDKKRVKHKGMGPYQSGANGKRVEFIFTEAKPPKR